METKHFSIGDALRWGFTTFVDHILFFLALMFIVFPIGVTAFFLVLFPCSYLGYLDQGTVLFSIIFLLCTCAFLFGASLLGTFLDLGFIKIQLELYDNDKSSVKTLFSQGELLFRGWAAHFLFLLLVGLGLACFVIPGIYFFCRFYFYHYALVDKRLGVFESFQEAAQLTHGARGMIFLFSVVCWILNIIPVVVLVTSLAAVYAYKKQEELVAKEVSPPFESTDG